MCEEVIKFLENDDFEIVMAWVGNAKIRQYESVLLHKNRIEINLKLVVVRVFLFAYFSIKNPDLTEQQIENRCSIKIRTMTKVEISRVADKLFTILFSE